MQLPKYAQQMYTSNNSQQPYCEHNYSVDWITKLFQDWIAIPTYMTKDKNKIYHF